MNKLLFLIDPGADAVETAADLILTLLTGAKLGPDAPRLTSLCVRTNPETQQIEIVAEYAAAAAKPVIRRSLDFAVRQVRQVKRRRCCTTGVLCAGVSARKN